VTTRSRLVSAIGLSDRPRDAAEDHKYTLDQNGSLKTLAPKIVKYVDEEHGWNRQNHQTRNQNKHLYSPLWPRILTGRPFSPAVHIKKRRSTNIMAAASVQLNHQKEPICG
jgi:hypothetical protein